MWPAIHYVQSVKIKPLKTWHVVIDLEFIIYKWYFSFPFVCPYSMHYTLWAFSHNISCIVHDLGVLRVIQKIQVMDSLQVHNLFTTNS